MGSVKCMVCFDCGERFRAESTGFYTRPVFDIFHDQEVEGEQ